MRERVPAVRRAPPRERGFSNTARRAPRAGRRPAGAGMAEAGGRGAAGTLKQLFRFRIARRRNATDRAAAEAGAAALRAASLCRPEGLDYRRPMAGGVGAEPKADSGAERRTDPLRAYPRRYRFGWEAAAGG